MKEDVCASLPGGRNFSFLEQGMPVVTNESPSKKFMLVKLQSSFNDKDSHINSSSRSNGVNEVLNFSHLQIPNSCADLLLRLRC